MKKSEIIFLLSRALVVDTFSNSFFDIRRLSNLDRYTFEFVVVMTICFVCKDRSQIYASWCYESISILESVTWKKIRYMLGGAMKTIQSYSVSHPSFPVVKCLRGQMKNSEKRDFFFLFLRFDVLIVSRILANRLTPMSCSKHAVLLFCNNKDFCDSDIKIWRKKGWRNSELDSLWWRQKWSEENYEMISVKQNLKEELE